MMSILLVIAGWLAGWWLLWRVPRLPVPVTAPEPQERPVADVAIVVPARNEARNLPGLLGSLQAQTVTVRETVVVDDDSADDTAAVAAAHGATVVAGRPVPPGSTGKSWACQQGADVTSATTIVFLDADVRLRPHALEAVLAEHRRVGGLVSVAPFHRMGSAVERLSAPFNVVAFMGVGAARPGRRGASDGAFGPCMVCARAEYESVGGHRVTGGSVTEDLALAEAFEDQGLPTWAFGGAASIDYRMYADGIAQLVEGWSKNLASGARFVSAWRSLLIGLWVTALLVTVQLVVLAALDRTAIRIAVAAAASLAVVVQQRVLAARLTDAGWGTALLFPVTIVFFVFVFVRSVWWTFVRRRVRWRGRTLDTGRDEHSVPIPWDG